MSVEMETCPAKIFERMLIDTSALALAAALFFTNLSDVVSDLGGGRMLTKEQGGSNIMESIDKVKVMLGSLDKHTDMSEVIESFMSNNKHGRYLQTSFLEKLLQKDFGSIISKHNLGGGRKLLRKEQGGSDIMKSINKVKDMLGSLVKETDMSEVIESFKASNKHGRHLQGLLGPQVIAAILIIIAEFLGIYGLIVALILSQNSFVCQ